MISIDDWVLRYEPPVPRHDKDWTPSRAEQSAGARAPTPLKIVAHALAKVKQETSPHAWLSYLGMATTWLAEHGPNADAHEIAEIAGHKTKVADTRRREP